jgi:NADH-quinone oxidoreductase subunit H
MLPMAVLNLVTTGVWHFMASGPLRWIVCAVMVVVPYVLLGRGLMQSKKLERRLYRFAE